MRICSVEGCTAKHMALGYCKRHYSLFRRSGQTEHVQSVRGDLNHILAYKHRGYVRWCFKEVDGRRGYALEHVVMMEKHLGRPLDPKETVHHINGDKSDNRIENLELWSSRHPRGQRVSDTIEWCKSFLADQGYKVVKA